MYYSKGTTFQLHKMSKSQRSTIWHSAYSEQYCIVHLEFAKRVDLMLTVLIHTYETLIVNSKGGRKFLAVMDV